MKKHYVSIIGIVCALLVSGIKIYTEQRSAPTSVTVQIVSNDAEVVRVVDGDTFVVRLNGVEEKVRMLGIDTPETVDPRKKVQCFGHEASDRLKSLLTGKKVMLAADPTNDDRDKYGRLLRYVSLPDEPDVNAAQIRDGYAFAYTAFPFERKERYLELQKEAREASRGLWAPSTCNGKHG